MTFIYVSGAGTDSSEKGSIRWARVKGIPRHACTLEEVSLAMIHCVTRNYEKPVVEVPDILRLAKE